MELSGKIAFVTGSARGIGAAIAKALLRNGCTSLLGCDINPSGATTILELNDKFGGSKAEFFQLDVTSQSNFRLAFEHCKKSFGSYPDVIVNNAGILGEDRWESVIDVNLKVL